MNPRKRRRRHSRRHGRRRSYRRNPGFTGGVIGDFKAVLPAVGWGLAGYGGMTVVPGLLSKVVPIPRKEDGPAMYYGVKLLTALGLGMLAGKMINRQAGRHVLAGSLLTLGAEAANQFALAPMGLATYLPDTVQDVDTYLPGSEPGMGYLSPGVTVDDMDDEESTVTRLDPNRRF